MKMLQLFPVKR